MKIAILNDTHCGIRNSSEIFLNNAERFYNDVFFPECEKHGIKQIVHLGDYYDHRKFVNFKALNHNRRIFLDQIRKRGMSMDIIPGNHDTFYKNTNELNSLKECLGHYMNEVHIIMEPTVMQYDSLKLGLLPWICQDNYDESMKAIKNTKCKSAFGHLELNGFQLFPGMVQTNAHMNMDVSAFKKLDVVFSGHYHTRSNDGKIFYLGNPYQIFWNDAGDKRGFHIFDTDTYELEFIPNPYTMFEKVYYEDTNYKLYDARHLKDKIVKVIVRKKTSQLEFDKFVDKIDKAGCYDLKVVENFEIDDEEVEFSTEESADTLTLLNKYIEESEFDLDKEVVKNIMKDVYREACEFE